MSCRADRLVASNLSIANTSRRSTEGRKRVLLLSPAFPPSTGGIERTAAELAGGLNDYSIKVVSGRPTEAERVGIRAPAGVKLHWAPNDPPYGRRAAVQLIRVAVQAGVRFRPDLVLALHTRTMPAARALQRLIGSRSILVVHAKELREQIGLARAAVRWADALVSVSKFSRCLVLEVGADRDRAHIIHPGVTPPPTPPLPLALRPGPPTIITLARMDERRKGHDVALEAMVRLQARLPEIRWIMVGEGSLREELRRTTKELGLADCVSWPGVVDDHELHHLLGTAHAFCLLSRNPPHGAAGEGFGIAFVEAGAHGLPVVAGGVPGVVEAVQHEVTGILVDPCDPDVVAAALERVLNDTTFAQQLADAGRARAQELAWPAVVDRYRTLIASVLAGPPRGQPCHELAWIRDLAAGPPLDV
jgi:glycosyltransferase involved in cell wall biosynthesis